MGFIVPVVIIALWQIAGSFGLIPVRWFPDPFTVANTIWEFLVTGELWEHIGITSMRVFAGFLIGSTVGTIVGALVGYSSTAKRLIDPMLQAIRNVPGLAWVPLYLLWFGIFETSKIALISSAVFFPVYLTLSAGIAQVDKRLLEVGMVFEFDAKSQITRIILPAAIPAWITGLRNGMGLAWLCVVAAELMGASKGIGFLMYDAQQVSRADIIIASMVLFAILGKICDWLLQVLGGRMLRYQSVG